MATVPTRTPGAQSRESNSGLQRSEADLRLGAWEPEGQAELSPILIVSASEAV